MSKLSEDIASVYLKEDLRKVLQKIRDKKELEEGLSGRALQSRIMDIAKANKIADPNKIFYGKTIDVGGGSRYTIKKGDTLTSIAKNFSGAGKTAQAAKPAPAAPKAAPKAAPSAAYDKTIPGAYNRLPSERFQPASSSQTSKPASQAAPAAPAAPAAQISPETAAQAARMRAAGAEAEAQAARISFLPDRFSSEQGIPIVSKAKMSTPSGVDAFAAQPPASMLPPPAETQTMHYAAPDRTNNPQPLVTVRSKDQEKRERARSQNEQTDYFNPAEKLRMPKDMTGGQYQGPTPGRPLRLPKDMANAQPPVEVRPTNPERLKTSITPIPSTMNESVVTVGSNKYRVI